MKQVTMSQVKQELADCLKTAQRETVVITSRGKPTGVLIGFETDEDWSDYQLETDPRFLRRIQQARNSLRKGNGVPLEQLDRYLGERSETKRAKRRR